MWLFNQIIGNNLLLSFIYLWHDPRPSSHTLMIYNSCIFIICNIIVNQRFVP